MAKLLMNLRHVPQDETDEVRALLDEQRIDYYETKANRWGLSSACLWLRNDAEYPRARSLLDAYQKERAQRMRAEHEERRRRGEADTWLTRLMENPLRFAIYVVAIVGMIYVALLPVLILNR